MAELRKLTPKARKWLLRGAVAGAVLTWVGIGWLRRDTLTPVDVGSTAPAFVYHTLDGDTVSLASLRGKVVVLNVWATWCAPCRWEMPSLENMSRELRPAGVEVVAVSVDAAPGALDMMGNPGGNVAEYVKETGLTFTVLRDPNAEIQKLYGIVGLPTTFVINRAGRVVSKVVGPAHWDAAPRIDELRELVKALS